MSEAPEPKGQVFVFSGAAGNVLTVGIKRVRNVLEGLGYKVYYFTSFGPQFYLDGGEELISKTRFNSKEALEAFVREKSRDNALNLTLGTSAGGFTAMKYAIENNFAAAVVFSGFSTFDTDMTKNDRRGTGPEGRNIMAYMHKLEPDNAKRNISAILEANTFDGKIHLFFAQGDVGDDFQARNIKHHKCTRLHPQKSSEHCFFEDIHRGFSHFWMQLERNPKSWKRP